MTVYQVRGTPENRYYVKHEDWQNMVNWFYKNNIDWMQECSATHGIGFSIRGNFDWFSLRWL